MTSEDLPATLAEATPALVPRILATRRSWPESDPKNTVVSFSKLAGPPICVAWTGGGDEHIVTWGDLERWGSDGSALAKAVSAERREQWERSVPLRRGAFHVPHPGPAPWYLRTRNPADVEALFQVRGRLALLIATTREVFVTGTDDREGLAAIADAALQAVRRAPQEAVSAELWVRGQDGWVTWPWPENRSRWGRSASGTLGDALRAEVAQAIGPEPTPAQPATPPTEPATAQKGDPEKVAAWGELARLFGLSPDATRSLLMAAADLPTFLDAHLDDMEQALWGLSRDDVTMREVLVYFLHREGAVTGNDRKADLDYAAAVLAESPVARRAGATVPVVEVDPDGDFVVGDNLVALQRAFEPFGVGVISVTEELGDLATYPLAERDALDDAAKRTGIRDLLNEW